jgi:hypothetical protein
MTCLLLVYGAQVPVPVVRLVRAFHILVLRGYVLPQLELGWHGECRDHQSQLVEPELHLGFRFLPHPLMLSQYHLRSMVPLLGDGHCRPPWYPLLGFQHRL